MNSSMNAIVGSWQLVAFEFRKADGTAVYPFGEHARGTIIYSDTGRYSAQLMRMDRPRIKRGDQMLGTLAEMEANFKGCISYFGSYEMNIEENLIIHHVEGSLFPNMEGTDQMRRFEFSGNRMQLKTQFISFDGEKAVGVLIWERV